MATDDQIYRMATSNRLLLADVLDDLDEEQWEQPTLCQGWTVHHLAAHMIHPLLIGFGRFLLIAARHRSGLNRTVDLVTRDLARKTPSELVTLLREHAGDRLKPPIIGPIGPFADTCIHLRDLARPLGLTADVPLEHWRLLMDYLTGPRVVPTLVPRGRLNGLALAATDTDWIDPRWRAAIEKDWPPGSAAVLTGPIEALALAITGRRVALVDLHGPGVELLASRSFHP